MLRAQREGVTMTESVIEVRHLRVRYPRSDADAVRAMSFTAHRGEIFGFLGPSGAGKSTTQRVLTKLLRRFDGDVTVLNRPLRDWRSDYYQHIGVGFELPAQFSKLTARENLGAFSGLYNRPTLHPGELLERVGLSAAADRRVATFSKGMRMRLNLARALLNRPDVLFLDEPTSGQDPVHAAMLRRLIREHADEGCTVFLTTHDMTTADELCDRVAFVSDGRIAGIDTPRAFKLGYGRPEVIVESRVDGRLQRREFTLERLAGDPDFAKLIAEGEIETIHTREATLDEVFAAVTGATL